MAVKGRWTFKPRKPDTGFDIITPFGRQWGVVYKRKLATTICYEFNYLRELDTLARNAMPTISDTELLAFLESRPPVETYRGKEATPIVSNLESEPISPHIQAKVRKILKDRGFSAYQD